MSQPLQFFAKKKDPEELRSKILEVTSGRSESYSVLVADYTSDFRLGMSETEIFDAASVNKIPILAAVYHFADRGEVDFSRIITLQAKDTQNYGTGSIRYDPPGSTYSIKTLAKLMIAKSDNTAAYLLASQIIGLPKIQTLINSWGLTQTDMNKNTTSNVDTELVFRKIIKGELTNQAQTTEILGFMKDTDFEDRLPALLPDTAIAYHKIGTVVGGIHDAGVIQGPKSKYYIGIFTRDASNEAGTVETITKISKIVWDFMN